jgi:catechol-2,3-dioxygenase
VRVTGLITYGLQIPSLEVGHTFYSDFGLEVAERGDSLVVRCEGRGMDQAVLSEGPRKRLHFVAFAVEPGSLREWQRHIERLGLRLEEAPGGAEPGGLWFRDPEGNLVNLRDHPLAPWRSFGETLTNVGDTMNRIDQAQWLKAGEAPRPRKLSHMLIFTQDIFAIEDFYTRTLGLKLSDRITGRATFMNCGPGDHHVFGFIQSSHPGLHHSSWEVANIDQIAIGAQEMANHGYAEGWGLGRHTLGSNLFHYIRDPWGSWIEYAADMDRITEDWKASDWDIPAAVWCPIMPEAFMVNHEEKYD